MEISLNKSDADLYIPDNSDSSQSLARTTHLGIGAHQDDLEIFAYHGIAACYRDPDKWFTGVTVTNGAGSPRIGAYAKMTDKEMQQVRLKEQRKAAAIGQYSAQFQLNYSSSEIKDPHKAEAVDDIMLILEKTQPNVVYTHNPFDKHDTHVAVFMKVLKAIRSLRQEIRPGKVLGVEVWRSLDWVADNQKIALITDKFPELANTLLGVFESQISGGKRYDLATVGRRLANATYHDSHSADQATHITWAVDLTRLMVENTFCIEDFVNEYIKNLAIDVRQRIIKMSGGRYSSLKDRPS